MSKDVSLAAIAALSLLQRAAIMAHADFRSQIARHNPRRTATRPILILILILHHRPRRSSIVQAR